MEKYLTFTVVKDTGKTKIYDVRSARYGNLLAQIKYYGAWRKYSFFPEPHTVFDVKCLNEIAVFINAQMEERRRGRTEG